MARIDPSHGFAAVYDLIYHDPAFLAGQMAFLAEWLPAPGGGAAVLDAGCGTGQHAAALAGLGYRVLGLDADPAMLRRARTRLAAAAPRPPAGSGGGAHPAVRDARRKAPSARGEPAVLLQAGLCQADLRRPLPLAAGQLAAIVCLESPLAYLNAGALAQALHEFRRVLVPGGRLVLDVFDYLDALGPEPGPAHTRRFATRMGHVAVRERHRHDPAAGVWRMDQAFHVRRGAGMSEFVVRHKFWMRSAGDYAAALEVAGFAIDAALPGYPHAASPTDRRMLFVARSAGPRSPA